MSVNNIVYKISAIDLISGTLNKINASTDALDNNMKSLGRTIKSVLTIGAIMEVGKAIVDAGTKVETTRIALTSLLRDSGKAQEVVTNAMVDAAKTPFDFTNVIEGQQKLIAAGSSAEDARKDFFNLGNAVSTTGGNMNEKMNSLVLVMQKIQNRGKATQREMNQFATQGLNMIGVLQKQGETVYDANGKVKVSYEQITNALQIAGQKGGQFYGALDNMSESTATKLSNVKDNIVNIFANLFEAGKSVFGPLLDALNAVLGLIFRLTQPGTGMNILIFLIRTVTAALAVQAVMWAVVNYEVILLTASFWALWLAENAALFGIPLLIGAVVAGFMWFSDTVGGVTNAFTILGSVAMSVFNTIGAGVKFIYDLFDVGFDQASENLKNSVSATWKETSDLYNKFSSEAGKTKKMKGEGETATDKSKFGGATGSAGSAGKAGKSAAAGVSGPKITTINITVGSLIKEFTIQTTNIKDGTDKLREMVTTVLAESLNDSQLIVR